MRQPAAAKRPAGETRGSSRPSERWFPLACVTYLLISNCLQNFSNSSFVHFGLGRHPVLHSSCVGLTTKLSPPLGTGSVFGGTVGPGCGDV